jgi:putative membrane protein
MTSLSISNLPVLNAVLNASSAILILFGYRFIRRGRILAHRNCMVSACVCSAAFLTSYVYYHVHVGVIHFLARGWIRPVYFTILASHTILAIVIVPMVITTLTFALRNRFLRHRAIARWTFPLWLYVSVTGVIIYWLLYHAYAS